MAEFANQDLRTVALSNQKSVYVGSGAPGTAYEGQHWVDISTDPPVLKVYDLTNTSWMTMYPVYYETQADAWAAPSQSPITNGTLVVLFNSTQAGTRLYVRSNGAWVNLDTASSPTLTGDADVGDVRPGSTFYKDDYTKLTGTLSVTTTQLFFDSFDSQTLTTDYEIISGASGDVPAAAETVEVAFSLKNDVGVGNGDMRIVYNGVQKVTESTGEVTPKLLPWKGDGLGIQAEISCQAKIDSSTGGTKCTYICWYQTI